MNIEEWRHKCTSQQCILATDSQATGEAECLHCPDTEAYWMYMCKQLAHGLLRLPASWLACTESSKAASCFLQPKSGQCAPCIQPYWGNQTLQRIPLRHFFCKAGNAKEFASDGVRILLMKLLSNLSLGWPRAHCAICWRKVHFVTESLPSAAQQLARCQPRCF